MFNIILSGTSQLVVFMARTGNAVAIAPLENNTATAAIKIERFFATRVDFIGNMCRRK